MATVTLALLKLARLVKIKVSWADLKAMLPVFFFMPILYFPLETAGIQMTSTSRAGMIIAVKPIFVTLLSALLIKEYPSRRQLPFVLTSVAGVIFIFFMQQCWSSWPTAAS
ncbi:MAG TPA: DMT family transporter [Bacillota bacterium]|nr:DMT family transporter [Bacillota bacterium]